MGNSPGRPRRSLWETLYERISRIYFGQERSGMKKASHLTQIESILRTALSAVDKANIANLARVSDGWGKIVGEPLAAASTPAELEYKRLLIWVKEPIWADSMMYMKSEIISRVNGLLGKEAVTSIRTVYKADFPEFQRKKPPPRKVPDPPEWAVRTVDEALVGVEDSELRSVLKRVMLKSVMFEKKRAPRR